jgi:hypothetical protein
MKRSLDERHHLITQQLDRAAQGVLEVGAHLIGVLVAVLIELIEQGRAAARGAGVLAVQQGGRRQQGIGVVLAQERAQLKAQQAGGGPLLAVDQQQLVAAHRQHPARRDLLAEDPLGDQLLPGFAALAVAIGEHLAQGRVVDLAAPAGGDRELQRVGRLIAGVEALHHPQPGLALGVAHLPQQWNLTGLAADQHGFGMGGKRIAQGFQEGLEEQLPLQPQPLRRFIRDADLGFPELLPGLAQRLELGLRCGCRCVDSPAARSASSCALACSAQRSRTFLISPASTLSR